MIEVGSINELQVAREVDFGVYLKGADDEEVLLPNRLAPEGCSIGDWLDVFIYLDSEDRRVATSQTPYAMVGDFALLRVAAVETVGAFLDWGLSKDLLVPFREQKVRLIAGQSYVVRVYLDAQSGRIVGSTKLDQFLNPDPCPYAVDEAVELMITQQTELGYKALVDGEFGGVLYKNEVFQRLNVGQLIQGYIKKVREDGKIDLILERPGYDKIDGIAGSILEHLNKSGGFIPITAKSPTDVVYDTFGVSKKNFKKAIGALYKHQQITIDSDGIRLVK